MFDAIDPSSLLWLLVGLLFGRRLSQGRRSASPDLATTVTARPTADDQDEQGILTLQERLIQAQLAYRQVQDISQFRAGYLTRTAHELRSPLNSLIGSLQMILADLCDDPAEEREFLTQACESAVKLVHLMDQVIDVSKVDYGVSPLSLQPLSLALLLEDVDKLTRLQAQNRNLRLRLTLPDPTVQIVADYDRLRQILVNLIDRSLMAMEEGTITVTTAVEPDSISIYIDDHRSVEDWQEPRDLLLQHQQAPDRRLDLSEPSLSPGLILIMNQIMLEEMHGHLALVERAIDRDSDAEAEPDTSVQVHCMLPRWVAPTTAL